MTSAEAVLDDATPVALLRMRALAPQQRKIFTSLVRVGWPAAVSILAVSARLHVCQVSAQLGRLVAHGAVVRVKRGVVTVHPDWETVAQVVRVRAM